MPVLKSTLSDWHKFPPPDWLSKLCGPCRKIAKIMDDNIGTKTTKVSLKMTDNFGDERYFICGIDHDGYLIFPYQPKEPK